MKSRANAVGSGGCMQETLFKAMTSHASTRILTGSELEICVG
jgi:hypothetical protein